MFLKSNLFRVLLRSFYKRIKHKNKASRKTNFKAIKDMIKDGQNVPLLKIDDE